MSPIPPVATALALPSATPSVALDPGTAGQSATARSLHLLGTGSLVFVSVAVVSMAGYFYHGRQTGNERNSIRPSNTWASFTRFFSSVRNHGSSASEMIASGRPVDLEIDSEKHVSTIYARFFHPTFWNLVEYHPATTSAPAIYVEGEADEPVSEQKLFARDHMVDDDDSDGSLEGGCENENAGQHRQVTPYDTCSGKNISFSSEIIGTTVRPGVFLRIPGEEGDSIETSPADSGLDLGILTMPLEPFDNGFETCDWKLDLARSSCDRILTTPPTSCNALTESSTKFGSTCSPYDGTVTTPTECEWSRDLSVASPLPHDGITTVPLRLAPRKRRYGMADMADLARTLKDAIPEDGYPLVSAKFPALPTRCEPEDDKSVTLSRDVCVHVRIIPDRDYPSTTTTSRRTDLSDHALKLVEMESFTARTLPQRSEPVVDIPVTSSYGAGVRSSLEDLRKSLNDPSGLTPHDECLDLMRRLLEELRDPNVECASRCLSEDSDSEYYGDCEYSTEDEGDEAIRSATDFQDR